MNEPILLKVKLEAENLKKGIIDGVAYSGAAIPTYMWYKNFIVDVSTLSSAKAKTPLFRDHDPSRVAGSGTVTIGDNQVLFKGQISKKTSHGQEIIDLADDDFDWEMSLGVYDGTIEEVEDTEVNGQMISHGFVLRNGLLREVSIVALGADKNTSATIMSLKGDQMKITELQYVALACACGGNKDTSPEELEKKVKEIKMESEADKAKIDVLNKEIEDLKAAIAAKEAELVKIKEGEEEAANMSQITEAVKAKGIKFSEEKMKEAAKSKEKTATLLSLIEGMESVKQIPNNFGGKTKVSSDDGSAAENDAEAILMKAEAFVKEGKAKNFLEAITMAGGRNV